MGIIELAITIIFYDSWSPTARPIRQQSIELPLQDRFHASEDACIRKAEEYLDKMRADLRHKPPPEIIVRVRSAVACAKLKAPET